MRTPAPILLAIALLAAGSAPAADLAQGEKLHNANCLSCHGPMAGGEPNAIYTRTDRRVSSAAGLRQQVQRCEQTLGLRWFDEDVDNVVGYLNERFYHFSP
jgi:mono/diheme cytochrome c family protein